MVAKKIVKPPLRHNLDTAPEESLKLGNQPPRKPRSHVGSDVNQ